MRRAGCVQGRRNVSTCASRSARWVSRRGRADGSRAEPPGRTPILPPCFRPRFFCLNGWMLPPISIASQTNRGQGGPPGPHRTLPGRVLPRQGPQRAHPSRTQAGGPWTELPRPEDAGAEPSGHVRLDYARASTIRQSLDSPLDSLAEAGVARISRRRFPAAPPSARSWSTPSASPVNCARPASASPSSSTSTSDQVRGDSRGTSSSSASSQRKRSAPPPALGL